MADVLFVMAQGVCALALLVGIQLVVAAAIDSAMAPNDTGDGACPHRSPDPETARARTAEGPARRLPQSRDSPV